MRYAPAGLTRRLRHLAAVAILAFAGSAGLAPAAAYTISNPYATGPSPADINIRNLRIFGDSFSMLKRMSFPNWAEQLRYDEINQNTDLTQVGALIGLAVSGATGGAYLGSTNDFATQVTRWLGTSPAFRTRDLTVVYFGYNDIKRSTDPSGADLTGAMADYRAALRRVINAGASGGGRRILLVMPHDWGRSPYYTANGLSSVMRQRTRVWNGLVAATARQSSYTGLVAVDLFTAMECVFNHPGDFGFTNVTDPLPLNGDPERYLYDYDDGFHFGHRGQVLIRQVIQYYLTQGWDWSNTYKDPKTARRNLTADLEAGKVFGIPCSPAAPAVTTADLAPPS
jgi:phospholipase/lecithinase/hemolysin